MTGFRGFVAGAGLSAALLAAGAPCLAAESAEKATLGEVKQEVGDAAKAIAGYTAEQRDEAVQKAKAALDDLDARIERLEKTLEEKWSKMDKATREKASAALRALRRQRNAAAEWYGALEHGSVEAWERTKRGFAGAFDALKGAWRKAEEDVGGDR